MSTSEETKLIQKQDSNVQNSSQFCRRLVTLTALLLFICVGLRALSELTRWASKSHAAKETATPNHWDCPSREGDLSFYNQLWCNNDDLLDAAYRTSFVQGLLTGTLSKSTINAFILQIALWEKKAARLFNNLCQYKECTRKVQHLYLTAAAYYSSASTETLSQHTTRTSEIVPNQPLKALLVFLQEMVKKYDIDYDALVITSDLRFWITLAKTINNERMADMPDTFEVWMEAVLHLEPYLNRIQTFVDTDLYPMDPTLANDISRTVLSFHVELLKAAA